MAKQKVLFLADDNTEFDTEQAADAHNAFLEAEFTIEAYIDYAELVRAQAGLMRRHLAAYTAFLKIDDLDQRIEAAQYRVEQERVAASEAAAKKRAEAKAAKDAAAAAPV